MADAISDSKNFADILLHEGLITEDQHVQGRKEYQSGSGERSLARIFVDMGAITEGVKIGVLQKKLDCQMLDIKDVNPRPDAAAQIPRDICEKHHLVPVRLENNRLVVAMEDPTDARAVAALEAATDHPLRLYLAKASDIAEAVRRLPEVEIVRQDTGRAKKIAGYLSISLLCGGPMVTFILLLMYHAPFQKFYQNLELDPFEEVLFFVLAWSAWAIIAYWINGLIFGEPEDEI